MYKLIILDDEVHICDGIAKIFPWKNIGFEVSGIFNSPNEALRYIDTHTIDVLMTDIRMPQISGIDVAKKLEISHPEIRVIFMSGYSDFEYMKSAIIYSVYDYILKPLNYDELLKCFQRLRDELDLHNGVSQVNEPPSYYAKITQTAKEYILSHLQSATLEEVSTLVHMSAGYLSQILKDHAGKSFSALLLEMRMEKAKELLEQINYKQYEIALMVGYTNPKNFSRAFKQYYGISPKQYRNGEG